MILLAYFMPYLLLIVGCLIGLYALYRFFVNADIVQIKGFFLLAIAVVLCSSLFVLAVTGRLPAAIALLSAVAPLAVGWWRARTQEEEEALSNFDPHDAVVTREEALDILGLEEDANIDEVKIAYKALMRKVHPDNEGSQWMAAKLNQAKEILMESQPKH